jgi:hypothetical protein
VDELANRSLAEAEQLGDLGAALAVNRRGDHRLVLAGGKAGQGSQRLGGQHPRLGRLLRRRSHQLDVFESGRHQRSPRGL